MKVASTILANPEWEALQNKCNERGVTIAEYLRDLIRNESNKTSGPDELAQSSDAGPVMENNDERAGRSRSSLSLFRKRQPEIGERQSESSHLDDMREQVRKQGLNVQGLVSHPL